jgi:hypothetical protein
LDEDYLIADFDAEKSWDKSLRRSLFQKIICTFKGCSIDLLSFDEVKSRLRLSQRIYRGIKEIELVNIRGSVGRYRDFTNAFFPLKKHMKDRWKRVNKLAITRGIPPIEVYQVGEAYFVLDGNHRVSVARSLGIKTIEAHVYEFVKSAGLSSEADLDELIIKEEYTNFLERTHLDKVRPNQKIIFTTPGQYRELECQIEIYRKYLEKSKKDKITFREAIPLWYDEFFTPIIEIIKKEGIINKFPHRTEADLYIWFWRYYHKWEKIIKSD